MNTDILEEIGLTKSEIKVYLALLELGSSATGKIVDKSKASSSKIYEILDKLIQKGLVSFIIKSGVKYFEAAPPERIMDYMKEKETQFNQQKQELKDILPQLELKQKLAKYKSEATIFKGIKGGETAFKYLINKMKKDDEWIGFVVQFQNRRYFDLLTKLHVWRAKKGLKSRIIFNEVAREDGKVREVLPLTKVKYVPKEVTTPAIVNVAGNIVLLNIMAEEVTVFMIENKEVADSFKGQFERMWNEDVNVSRGLQSVEDAWNSMLDELKPGETYYVMGASWRGQKKKVFNWYRDFHKRRIDKKVKAKFLFVAGTEKTIEEHKDRYKVLSEVKFLPEGVYEGIQFNMYNDKLLIIVWRGKDPVVFTIEDKHVYKTFMTYFNTLWNRETRILRGMDELKNIFDEMLDYGKGDLIGGRGYFVDREPKWIDAWEKRAIKKGFKMRNIVDKETKGHRITTFPFIETKYTLPIEFSKLSVIWMYGNKVLISNWTEKEPIVVVMENKNIVDMYRQQFKLLWQIEEIKVKK